MINPITESVKGALIQQSRLAFIWEQEAQKTEGGFGLAVGAGNIDYRWKTDAMRSMIRRIYSGEDPNEAAAAVKLEARRWIARHNARRPKDVNWARWEGSADDSIDGVLRAIFCKQSKTKSTV